MFFKMLLSNRGVSVNSRRYAEVILFINDVFAKVLKTDQYIDGLGFDIGIYNLVLGGVVALTVFRYLPRFLVRRRVPAYECRRTRLILR